MKAHYFFFALFCYAIFFITPATAQDTTAAVSADTLWKVGGDVAVNFSNVGLTNWNGGGESSLSLSNIVNLFADYESENHTWTNTLTMAYGLIRQGDEQDFRKSDDVIILLSDYGYKFAPKWRLSTALDFRTQFASGFQYEEIPNSDQEREIFISEFMAPGFLLGSAGITYKIMDGWTVTYSPLTSKLTFVLNDSLSDAGAFGVEAGENIRAQLGTNFSLRFNRPIAENVEFRTNLNLFADYEAMANIDVNCEAILLFRINNWLTSSVTSQLIYDDDIKIPAEDDPDDLAPRVQWKNVINVGLSFSFGYKKEE